MSHFPLKSTFDYLVIYVYIWSKVQLKYDDARHMLFDASNVEKVKGMCNIENWFLLHSKFLILNDSEINRRPHSKLFMW